MSYEAFINDFVFFYKVENHKDIKADLLPKIEARYEATKGSLDSIWHGDVNSEYRMPEFEKYKRLIDEAIYPALDQMLIEVPNLNRPSYSKVTHIWYNHYENGQSQEVHTHIAANERTTISGVYFIELNEPNKTVFYSYESNFNPLARLTIDTKDMVKEGDIILFPSKLLHYVLPAELPRTTVAFNVVCDF